MVVTLFFVSQNLSLYITEFFGQNHRNRICDEARFYVLKRQNLQYLESDMSVLVRHVTELLISSKRKLIFKCSTD